MRQDAGTDRRGSRMDFARAVRKVGMDVFRAHAHACGAITGWCCDGEAQEDRGKVGLDESRTSAPVFVFLFLFCGFWLFAVFRLRMWMGIDGVASARWLVGRYGRWSSAHWLIASSLGMPFSSLLLM